MDVAEIEKRVDRAIAGAVVVNADIGGVKFASMVEVMEFAKLMAVAGIAVPQHLRGNPGACLGIVVQAQELRVSPFALANKSYVANDRLAYESQVIHAIVEARAPIKGRLRHQIIGEEDERRCKVWATFRGEDSPHEYVSETLGKLRGARGKNDRGQVKGSPMWVDQPEVQLFYSASRTWARMFCPDVILGIYAIDELPNEPVEVTAPQLSRADEYAQKLRDTRASRTNTGFDAEKVMRTIIEGEVNTDDAKAEDAKHASAERDDSKSVGQGGGGDLAGRGGVDPDADGRDSTGGAGASAGADAAGHSAEGRSPEDGGEEPGQKAVRSKSKRR